MQTEPNQIPSEPNLSFFQEPNRNRTEIKKSIPHIPNFLETLQYNAARYSLLLHSNVHRIMLQVTYELQALLLHRGASSSSGHYEAIVCHGGSWMRCSDDVVSATTAEEALSASGDVYMCIYTGFTAFTCTITGGCCTLFSMSCTDTANMYTATCSVLS